MGYRFDFYDKIKETDKEAQSAFNKIEKIYQKMPETKGCMENISTCKAWCCELQSPQFLFVEFLHIWDYVIKNCTVDQIFTFIENAVYNYIKGDVNKPCVFFDKKTRFCPIHECRGFACRLYGIMDPEEFKEQYDAIKEKYKDNIEMVIKDQCDLISCKNGDDFVSRAKSNSWFNSLKKIEKDLGIREDFINDSDSGSYRTPHDHILIKLFPTSVIQSLDQIRNIKEKEIREQAVHDFLQNVKKWLFKVMGQNKKENE